MAELHGFRDYPFVVLPHPVTSLSTSEVAERADAVTAEVESLLLGVVGGDVPVPDGAVDRPLEEIVEELATGLRSDRADLSGTVTGSHTVTLELHIPDQACAECVLPADRLLPVFERRVRSGLGDHWNVELVDPRASEEDTQDLP